MFPLRDDIPSRTVPFVNYLMMGICALVFFGQLSGGEESTMVERYGMIPARVKNPAADVQIPEVRLEQTRAGQRQVVVTRPAAPSSVPSWMTMLTCVFLHGGWMHFLGNMWFLYIFGDNVEDRFGHVMFLVFYLGSGVAASLAHYLADPSSMMPTIGASGAIAGVMGAYFVFYPKARVLSVVPLGPLLQTFEIPAPLFLGFWFLVQVFSNFSSGTGAGVAWWAHIGGFVVGAGGALLMNVLHMARPPVVERVPQSNRFTYGPRHRSRSEHWN